MNQREAQARVEVMNFMPRTNYQGDGKTVPRLQAMDPVTNRLTGALEFLLMDADTLEQATYYMVLPVGDAPPRAFIGAANQRFYAEWN